MTLDGETLEAGSHRSFQKADSGQPGERVCVCVYKYVYVCVCVYKYVFMYMCMYVFVCMCLCT